MADLPRYGGIDLGPETDIGEYAAEFAIGDPLRHGGQRIAQFHRQEAQSVFCLGQFLHAVQIEAEQRENFHDVFRILAAFRTILHGDGPALRLIGFQ